MGICDKRVLRWEHTVESGSEGIVVHDDGGIPTITTEAITPGDYLTKGEYTSGPDDFVAAFAAALNAAYVTLYGSGSPITGTLDTKGRIVLTHVGARDLSGAWSNPSSSLPTKTAGESTSTTLRVIPAGADTTFPYIASGQWYPDRTHTDDAPTRDAHTIAETEGLSMVPDYVVHSDLDRPARLRRISWEDIAGARMIQDLTDDAIAAAVAGVATGDTAAAFENVVRYTLDPSTPSPGEVYTYTTEDPSTHVEQGPYALRLPQQVGVFGGVAYEMERDDLTQRRYAFSLDLTEVP